VKAVFPEDVEARLESVVRIGELHEDPSRQELHLVNYVIITVRGDQEFVRFTLPDMRDTIINSISAAFNILFNKIILTMYQVICMCAYVELNSMQMDKVICTSIYL
jgi:hypothetical protein